MYKSNEYKLLRSATKKVKTEQPSDHSKLIVQFSHTAQMA